MPRLYGRKGFTMKKSVRNLLAPYEVTSDGDQRVQIERLPAGLAARLLDELPEPQGDDRAQDGAPTFAEFVNIASQIDGAVLSGYRIEPEHVDERITLTRLTIPYEASSAPGVATLAKSVPDPSAIAIGADGSVYARWD